MLLILTGDVRIGKTRWLQRAVARLEGAGVACHGVMAPGIWEPREDGSFDKLGIRNELLPGHELVSFARRADLARKEGAFNERSQAARAKLGWHISDEAIGRVNAHFEALASFRDAASGAVKPKAALLVVDELGQLELLRGEGLVSAMTALSAGPGETYTHALVVVRDRFGLVECAQERFASIWGGSVRIAPTEEAWHAWLEPLTHADS